MKSRNVIEEPKKTNPPPGAPWGRRLKLNTEQGTREAGLLQTLIKSPAPARFSLAARSRLGAGVRGALLLAYQSFSPTK